MRHSLRIPESVQNLIRHLSPEVKKRIRSALDEIRLDPEAGKPLSEELEGFRSYKAGQLRIVYRRSSGLVEITNVGPRRTIYRMITLEIKHQKEKNF